MSLRALHMGFDARNLGLQRLNAFDQLGDRHRIEILARKLDQRIAWLAWEEILKVHRRNR